LRWDVARERAHPEVQLELKTFGGQSRCFLDDRDQPSSGLRALPGQEEDDSMITQRAAREIAPPAPELDAGALKSAAL